MTLYYSTQMATITGNVSGAIQSLLQPSQAGGRKRTFVANITLASQVAGSTFAIARLPVGAAIMGINLMTDTSLGSTTLAIGDAKSGNSALYAAAATLTATDTPTSVGKTATRGLPIVSGYDSATGALSAGNIYEDVIITTAAATLPASGNLVVELDYVID